MSLEALDRLRTRQALQGIRRLLVISGAPGWCEARATELSERYDGDWLWVSPQPRDGRYCAPGALRRLLGREFMHAVFDARQGLDAEALAALAGTLKAGSWLVLLTPDWRAWPVKPDADSIRWSDTPQPIPTPVFIRHLRNCIEADAHTLLWRQGEALRAADDDRPHWQAASGAPLAGQRAILANLRRMTTGVAVVTAPRGRGKSALAGMLVHSWPGAVIITAPARAATDVLSQHALGRGFFIAPDALLQALEEGTAPHGDWLIIDEAAALPAPQLRRLIAHYPRVLMTTTVQGYEGTGRGFMLKFCASVPGLRHYSLTTPVRWAAGCPLERIIDEMMLFNDALPEPGRVAFQTKDAPVKNLWRSAPALAKQVYLLLSGAHYRTSPLDLRRMMDAPGQRFVTVRGDSAAAAAWLVEEGGLPPLLSFSVWAGLRRPRGNLVAQSLAAHGASPFAAMLKGLRVSRIAVHPRLQRQGYGSCLLAGLPAHARGYDYLSVSFGYTEELWRFWQRAGFQLVRFGTHREASSGCYAAMALRPLTPAGETLVRLQRERLMRDVRWLEREVDEKIPVNAAQASTLNKRDWWELAGFAFTHRPPQASLASLQRLLLNVSLPLPALRAWLEQRQCVTRICATLGLTGQKALRAAWRRETAQALRALNGTRADALMKLLSRVKKFQPQF
ncbi:tRNA(Met) cytidine acetyltransferase [Enterobacteriaceae bacterium YMB-R22]|uniref:tRNA(Met) cytidine acetyltransferase TmcA n=1 Tax=Tenebrionicola larvae TaxID=2815733 RepID=UPI00201206B0|nr:GNAT family N-acetyltransferase [Tenebrionicola larvae]MBV4411781.1 tRNA(Met) cytidine acetyltransferase [Tenebrionicola larvae]